MKHYTYGGSTAARTLNCPAWISEAAKAPKLERTSGAAERGTRMHAVLEAAMLDEKPPADVLPPGHGFDERDLEHMQAAYDMVEEVFTRYNVTDFAIEPTMEMTPEIGGSTDVIGAGPEHCLVIDYKFGARAVDVTNNAQLAFYHMMAFHSDKTVDLVTGRKFVGVIIQPAVSFKPLVYEYSVEEVNNFRRAMGTAIEQSKILGMEPNAGKHCDYCPAIPYCPAQRGKVSAALRMSPKQAKDLSEAMGMIAQLKTFIDSVEAETLLALQTGIAVPGYKLVPKRLIRKWADSISVVEFLQQAGLTDKDYLKSAELKTPAQLDKVLKTLKLELDVDSLLDTSEPGLTVVPDEDSRAKKTVN